MVRRAVLHPHGKAPCRAPDRAASRLQVPAPAGLRTEDAQSEPDQFVVRLDPTTGVRIVLSAHRADAPKPTPSSSTWSSRPRGGGPDPYEVLLHAAMLGLSTRFTRQDSVEEEWRVMQPLIDAPRRSHSYRPGSWGPDAADSLVADHGGWRGLWTP